MAMVGEEGRREKDEVGKRENSWGEEERVGREGRGEGE